MTTRSQTPETADSTAELLEDCCFPPPGETKTMKVSPALAEAWIDFADFSRQRNRRQQHIERILKLMEAGEWDPSIGQIVFAYCESNDTLYNVDGQHTLHAIVEYGEPVRMDVRVFVRPDEEEIAVLFSRFDVGYRRSAGDNISAFRLQDEFNLSKTQLGKIGSAVKFIEGGFSGASTDKYTMNKYGLMEAVREWAPAGETFFPLVEGANSTITAKLRYRAVLSVGLVTCRYAPTVAREFWRQVAWQDRIGRYDPRSKLHNYLLTHELKSRNSSKDFVTEKKLTRIVDRAWIHWYNDREEAEVKLLRVQKEDRPMRLPGTPFGG